MRIIGLWQHDKNMMDDGQEWTMQNCSSSISISNCDCVCDESSCSSQILDDRRFESGAPLHQSDPTKHPTATTLFCVLCGGGDLSSHMHKHDSD